MTPPAAGASLRAAACIVAAVACFAALDSATKQISATVPVVMAIWFRYLFQALVTAVALLPRRGRRLLQTRRPGLQIARGLLLVAASTIAFYSLRAMPVGEFTAIVMLTPLVVTLLAVAALGERVSPLQWALLAGGFAGALLVIRPGASAFGWAALLPLVLVGCNAGFQVITSRLAKTEDAGTMHFYTGCVGAAFATLALPFAWQPLERWSDWAVLLLLGVFSTLGHYLLILGYGRAPASTLTPLLYLQIGFAMFAGWLVFGHTPDRWAIAGVLLIAACGAAGTRLGGGRGR